MAENSKKKLLPTGKFAQHQRWSGDGRHDEWRSRYSVLQSVWELLEGGLHDAKKTPPSNRPTSLMSGDGMTDGGQESIHHTYNSSLVWELLLTI